MRPVSIALLSVAGLVLIYAAWTFLIRPVETHAELANPVEWRKLDDGSFFLRDDGDRRQSATRCWPKNDGHECIRVGAMAGETSVSVADIGALPDDGDIKDVYEDESGHFRADGYKCSHNVGTMEIIVTGLEPLVRNEGFPIKPWSRSYVEKFIADNGVKGRWFNCVGVLKAIENGSVATLGTTIITRKLAFGG